MLFYTQNRKELIRTKVELLISSADTETLYLPAVVEGIEWTTQRSGAPGKLTFSVISDGRADLSEGSSVRLRVDGKNVFFGFVFSKKRDKSGVIDVTAYDQLRYLQNKDTYVYENKTASQLVCMIAAEFSLNVGTIENTGYVIPSRVEDNTSLLDMIENALDLTLQNRKEMYVLYDDFGRLTLKNTANMYVGESGKYLMIDQQTGENFDCTSSIDNDTYNRIKLTYDNKDTGKREVYIAQDAASMNRWGVLQYFDTLSEGENGQAKAEALLSGYNAKTRKLKLTGAFGDTRVRAGSTVAVNLDLGDTKVQTFMLVEKAVHTFKQDEHRMELTLKGGEFVA